VQGRIALNFIREAASAKEAIIESSQVLDGGLETVPRPASAGAVCPRSAWIELAERRSPLFERPWVPVLTYRTAFPMVEGLLK
jgi:hypothetical protein